MLEPPCAKTLNSSTTKLVVWRATHNRYIDDFTHLDEERINLATDRVRRAHGERAIATMNANPAGEQLILLRFMKPQT